MSFMLQKLSEKIKSNQLTARVFSGIVLIAIALIADYFSPLFGLLCVAIALVAFWEWYNLVNQGKKARLFTALCGVAVLFPMLLSSHLSIEIGVLGLCFFAATFFLICTLFNTLRRSFVLSLGVLYIGIPMSILVWLRSDNDVGFFLILYLFFVTWGSDITAYFVGKKFGKKKLAPKISPNKTWEGFWGACAGSLVGGLIVAGLYALYKMGEPSFDVAYMSIFDLPLYAVIIISFIMGGIGQIGDLCESFVKRHYKVKDSGSLIPGHGGVLDRVDALLVIAFVFGFVHYVIQSFLQMSI